MNDKQVNIIVKLIDNASKQLENVKGNVNKLSSSVGDLSKLGIKEFSSFGKSASIALTGVVASAGVAGIALFNLSKEASNLATVGTYFNKQFSQKGIDGLERLREATRGTIPDMKMMEIANKASLLGVADNVEELAGLFNTARLRGQAMGITTEQAFNDIVIGIGRGSPLILDNLGIQIPEALKKTMEGMSETEKKQTLLSFAIEDGAVLQEQLGGISLTNAERFAQLSTKIANFKQELGDRLSPIILLVVDKMTELYNKVKIELAPQIEIIREKIAILGEKIREKLPTWEEFSNKIVDGATKIADLTIKVLDFIDNNPTLVRTITTITGLFIGFSVAVWLVTTAAGVLGGALALIFSPLGLIIILVGLIIANWEQLVVTWDWIKDRISNSGSILKENLIWIFEGIVQGVKDSMNSMIGIINNAIIKVNGFIAKTAGNETSQWLFGKGFAGTRLPTIPYLAKGGIVTRPTLAMVGEAGPEAVVPLSGSNTPQMGGEPHLHLHIENFYGNDAEKDALALDIWKRVNSIAKSRSQSPSELFQFI